MWAATELKYFHTPPSPSLAVRMWRRRRRQCQR